MLNKINIKNTATYDSEGIEIDLKKINYIFGSNGTGKTTISESLRNESAFTYCGMEWEQKNPNLDLFVYNRHFIEENFNMHSGIKGIFTLGKESSDILNEIDQKSKNIKKHDDRIKTLEGNIGEKEKRLTELNDYFADRCWDLKSKYDDSFKEALTGLRSKKDKFMKRCLWEAENNNGSLFTYDKLLERVETVFKSEQKKFSQIGKIEYNESLESDSIYRTKIIGKEDIDIADLISRLNISDWVQQGHTHIENTSGICPFCQQNLPKNFKQKLDEYFDEKYIKQIHDLNLSIDNYTKKTDNIIEKYQFLNNDDIPFIDADKVADILKSVNLAYGENRTLLEKKQTEPSQSIILNPLTDYFKQINHEIEKADKQITEWNRVIDNLEQEKQKLVKDIWHFIVNENKDNYRYYIQEYEKENKAFEGMKENRKLQKGFKEEIEKSITELQNKLTSVLPSINEINELLQSFGFTNFRLAESDEAGNYMIVRDNGIDAKGTLSEGEKTFITFLYFYQLINGSNDQSNVNTERVIVIDDPISSLDSNILFIVGNLINGLKKRIRIDDLNFKQLIILTHNVYFHKEISFNKGKNNQKQGDETFWILRKVGNVSQIKEYDENPIKNSYELLWKELQENPSSITTPNIMRRILENYFKFFGNIDVNEIVDDFPSKEKLVCNSLLSWTNDGSHHVNDDLFVDSSKELNTIYFNVFKKIFINSNHQSHYHMMMGYNDGEQPSVSEKFATDGQIAMDQSAASQE